MNIEYFIPLSKAWQRMVQALFKPFDIGKWFALGFTAFLAHLLDGGFSGGWPPGNFRSGDAANLPDIGRIAASVSDWIQSHPLLTAAILIAVIVFIGIVIVLTWLSSRGAFMFLDNVVHNRALVIRPWREYKSRGNSLFLWRIAFGVVVGLAMLFFAVLAFVQIVQYARGHIDLPGILALAAIGILWLVVSVVAGYISLFTGSFVIPIMYKQDLRILQAWRKFLPILASRFLHFVLYGLFFALLLIAVFIAAFLAGCFTCCIGFIILALPYIGSVFLLPAYFVFRAFPLEFLAQWGPDYSVFPDDAVPPGSVPPPPVSPTAGMGAPGI
ncbi:MAG: hypothetical protein JW793_09925 [Acidobacteria bacterium]|nr:hypothetical protein [Acidobacteriota bacterium]